MSGTCETDRRQRLERRTGSERRHQAEGRCAVLEICRSMLHLALVVRSGGADGAGDKVVTRSIRWRKGATSLHSERGVQELTAALRTLATEERLAGARARIALDGEFCVTRVITGSTEEVRREFAELEERSSRYLTLGPGPKALADDVQQLDARHQRALLAVANQRTLDVLMRVAEGVGLQVESIEPSLLALSRAQARLRDACQEACLLIQLSEDVAELGICHGGRLLLDYRPGGHTGADDVADLVAKHLSRLQRYIERYHSYLEAPLRHVYLAGDASAVERARKSFDRLEGFEVRVVEPGDLDVPWQHAGEMPGTGLAAALGTALTLYSDRSESPGPNLIENTLSQQRPPLRPVLVRSLLPLAAVLLVAATLLTLQLMQRGEKSRLRAELDHLRPASVRATELRLQLVAADAKIGQLEALAEQLPQPDWPRLIRQIGQSMPDDVWLDRLSVQDGRAASVSGASYTDGGVYDFAGYLSGVPEIAEIALEGTRMGHGPTGPTTAFDLKLTLASPSGRREREDRHD